MKNIFIKSLAILTLAFAGALTLAAQTPTTDPGNGPSEQPNAPMEMGQQQPAPPSQAGPPPDAGQPAQPGQPPQAGQAPGPDAQPDDGPSGEEPAKTDQGVGRVSMMHGDVSTQRGDSGTWSAAILNQPVMNGDKVSTGDGGRAEVQLDYSNILRLGTNSQANIANFTNKYIQIQVAQGIANYSVWGESEAEPEIDTPNVSVHPAHQDGVYRIEVRPDGDSVVIVRKGAAQISTPQGIADLKQGEMATVHGAGQDAHYKISSASDRDDWDRWNIERDRMIHNANAWQHTNKYYVGSEDLDANGRWQNVPDYGQVWVPNESEDWAPYRDGNWTWEPYYGWTWVGYEPWGWAPYHYGRWLWTGGNWGWWPGPVWGAGFYRPFWSPAYVSFFGFGGFGVGLGWGGWGGFGWLPLGPGDWFHPWWGGYGGRFGVVGFDRFGAGGRFGGFAPLHTGTRFSNIAHINDAHIGGGVSAVGAGQFGAGHVTAATHEQIGSARMMTGNMPVVPSRASLSASGRAAAPSTIHNNASEHFAGTHSASRPESFSQQTARLQQSMQQSHFTPTTASSRSAGSTESRSAAATRSSGQPGAGTSATNRGAGASSNRGRTTFANRPESSSSANRSESSRGESTGRESGSRSYGRSESGSYWNRTAPSSNSRGGYGSSSGYGRGYSRPQLNMRQPIAQPRSGASGGSRSYGGYSGSGSHSSTSSGGSHSSSGGGGGHSGGGGHH
jgi:FecR protein